jgi:hypothetical protein
MHSPTAAIPPVVAHRPESDQNPDHLPRAPVDATIRICHELFDLLGPLHHLRAHDVDILASAADIRALVANGRVGQSDFQSYDWPDVTAWGDALLADAVVHYSADSLPHGGHTSSRRLVPDDRRRVLWLAAILRLAESLEPHIAGERSGEPLYIAWTDDVLYIEVDRSAVDSSVLQASSRKAALESVSGRRVLLATSSGRLPGAA